MEKSKSWYSKWHEKPHHQLVHVLVLIVIVALLGWLIVTRITDENAETYGLEGAAGEQPSVRFIYLSNSDKPYNPAYNTAIKRAADTLKNWYAGQLGGRSFHFTVEHYATSRPSTYYSGNCDQWGYYIRTLEDGFALTGGFFDDPNNRWIFINAATICENQGAGGTNGVAVLHGSDLDGLASSSPNRFIGGLGHELGHAFTLPHPAGCPQTGDCWSPIMYLGYLIFPRDQTREVVLTDSDKLTLLGSSQLSRFFSPSPTTARSPRKPDKNPAKNLPVKEDGVKTKDAVEKKVTAPSNIEAKLPEKSDN